MRSAFHHAILAAAGAALLTGGCAARCAVQKDEVAQLYPVFAHQTDKGDWEVPVHGRIYKPAGGLLTGGALSLLKTVMSIPDRGEGIRVFEERAESFLVRAPSGRNVRVRIGDHHYKASEVDAGGHFRQVVRIPDKRVKALPGDARPAAYEVKSCDGAGNHAGEIYFLGDQGLSVLSSVEDTIQVAGFPQRDEAVKNLLFREYRAVPGMQEVFDVWRSSGAAFHYVAMTPWQLYPSVSEFIQVNGFPPGSVQMRRWGDESGGLTGRIENLVSLFASDREDKARTMSELIEQFPGRRFILVGNTAGTDPEVFAGLLLRYPDQIERAYLREAPVQGSAERARAALRAFPEAKWRLFRNPTELTTRLSLAD